MAEGARNHTAGVDMERLTALVEPIVRAHGAEIVGVELKTELGRWVLRVLVEKFGSAASNASLEDAAVSLELCAGVARDLSPALDVADLIAHHYNLEVGSPGIERPLRNERDFVRFAGKKAKLKLHDAVGGQKVLTGTLGVHPHSSKDETVDVTGVDFITITDENSKSYEIQIANISSARLVFEFGPARRQSGKPGKLGKVKKDLQR